MAAQVNVYVPDELKVRLDESELPLSQLARGVWERELARARAAADAGEIRLDAVDTDGTEIELRFSGEEVGGGVYRTDDERAILVPDEDGYEVWTRGEIDGDGDAFIESVWRTVNSWNGRDPETVTSILRTFDVKPIVDL